MPIEIIKQFDLPKGHIALRFNKDDTKFLLEQVIDAVQRNTGVSFVVQNIPARIGLVRTKEHGYEIKLATFTDDASRRIETEMKGYDGKWSHLDMFVSAKTGWQILTMALKEFFDTAKNNGKPERIEHGIKEKVG